MNSLKKYYSFLAFFIVLVIYGQNGQSHCVDIDPIKFSRLEKKLDSLDLVYKKGITTPQELYNSVTKIFDNASNKDLRAEIKSRKLLGIINRKLNKREESYYNVRIAYEKLTPEIKYSSLGYSVVVYYASLFEEAKDYNHALMFYKESLDILNTICPYPSVERFFCKSEIAKLYTKKNDFNNALIYYDKSVECAKKLEDKLWYSSGLNNIGFLYMSEKKLDKAIEHFLLAKENLNLNIKEHKLFDVNIDENIAKVYFLKDDYKTALNIFKNTSEVRRTFNDSAQAIKSDIGGLKCAVLLNNNQEANSLIEGIDDYYKKNSLIYSNYLDRSIGVYHETKLDYYLNSNNTVKYKEASKTYHQYLKDKHENQEDIVREAVISFMALQESNFDNQIKLKKEQEKAQQRDISILISILILLGLIVTLLLMLMRMRKLKLKNTILEKKTLDDKLQLKEKDIVNISSNRRMNISFLENLLQDIKKASYDKETQSVNEKLKTIIVNLKSQIVLEERLATLQSDISKVNARFNKTLMENFPGLTKTEREICSFIRLNLSIKEISQIRNSSTDSVKTMRSRIRKKMGLSPNQDLDKIIGLL